MACKSTIERQKRLAQTVQKYRALREKLKKDKDYAGLLKLPRDASPTRLKSYCMLTGRTRAVYKKFKISRIMLRELALQGKIPGMRKSSW